MGRYFIEVAYKGTAYSGFQTQPTGKTIQGVLEHALATIFREPITLTGSSRTDSGVHALQNFFHTDTHVHLQQQHVYNLNALLPNDVVVRRIILMHDAAHARFDALSRQYRYHLHARPDPFLSDISWHYPYPLDLNVMDAAAAWLLTHQDFTSFSKRNTQAKTMICALYQSRWIQVDHGLQYEVAGNRFLRGMVRALVGTMLQVGRGKISLQQFQAIANARDCRQADFSTPAHGLFLEKVVYPDDYFPHG